MPKLSGPTASETVTDITGAARHVGLSTKSVRRRIAEGVLPAYRVAGTRAIRIRVSDLDALLERIPAGGAR